MGDTSLREYRPLHIAQFSESFVPIQNGVVTSITTLTDALRMRGHRIETVAPAHPDSPPGERDVIRTPAFTTPANRDYPLAYPLLPALLARRRISAPGPDIVHTHTPFVLGLAGARFAKVRGASLVSTYHTLYSEYSHYAGFLPERLVRRLLEAYLPWYYNHCDAIICPSRTAVRHLRSLGVHRAIEIIPTGVPMPAAERVGKSAVAALRRESGIDPGATVLLYAGRLAVEKRIEWLVDAVALILRQTPNCVFVIVGDGPLRETLQKRSSELRLSGAVRFLGALPRQKMDTVYAASQLLLFASPTETQGLVIDEARAAGLPAVVIDSGGAAEGVQHGADGFVIPEGRLDLFSECVVHILQNGSLLDQMRRAAIANAGRNTPSEMADRVVEIYLRAGERSIRRRSNFAGRAVGDLRQSGHSSAENGIHPPHAIQGKVEPW